MSKSNLNQFSTDMVHKMLGKLARNCVNLKNQKSQRARHTKFLKFEKDWKVWSGTESVLPMISTVNRKYIESVNIVLHVAKGKWACQFTEKWV